MLVGPGLACSYKIYLFSFQIDTELSALWYAGDRSETARSGDRNGKLPCTRQAQEFEREWPESTSRM